MTELPHIASASPDRRLALDTLWSCLGLLAPLPVALLVIPFLTERLGPDRFGVLALSWVVIAYVALCELGVGRAMIKLAAERSGGGRAEEWGGLYWTATWLLLGLGILAGLIVAGASGWLVNSALRLPENLRAEARASFLLLSLAMPALALASAPIAILTVLRRFDAINMIRMPLSIFLFVGPALVALFSVRLPAVVGILAASRYLAWGVNLLWCHKLCPELWQARRRFEPALVRSLLAFGGWLTLIHLVTPLMLNLDRFLVGALVSTAAVAYYAIPSEALTRLWALPSAIVAVLYPAFAATLPIDPARAALLYERAVKVLALLLFPPLLAVVLFGPEGLGLWLGPDYRAASSGVLRLVAIGVFAQGINSVSAELINAAGRPAATAKLRLLELVPYGVLAFVLTHRLGIEGTALAWLLRVLVDTCLLSLCADRILRGCLRWIAVTVIPGVALLVLGSFLGGLGLRLFYFAVAVLGMLSVASLFWLGSGQRGTLGSRARGALRL